MAADGLTRWSQVVRTPGSVRVHGHHEQQVPAIGGSTPGEPGRAGVRLLGTPIAAGPGSHAIDVTSTAVIGMLEGFLRSGVIVGKSLSWQSRGRGARRRDTVKINWE